MMIVAEVAVSPNKGLGELLGDPSGGRVEVLGILEDVTRDEN